MAHKPPYGYIDKVLSSTKEAKRMQKENDASRQEFNKQKAREQAKKDAQPQTK